MSRSDQGKAEYADMMDGSDDGEDYELDQKQII
jgi:hypothetical protein